MSSNKNNVKNVENNNVQSEEKVEEVKTEKKKFDFKNIEWNKRIGNSEKGTEDYVNPYISWGSIGGVLLVCIIIAIIAI